jgi:hypothetical protein
MDINVNPKASVGLLFFVLGSLAARWLPALARIGAER